jgi:hypothetical protein
MKDESQASSGVACSDKLLISNSLRTDAGAQQADHEVGFHGVAVEPVIELGNIARKMFLLDSGQGSSPRITPTVKML